MEDKEIIEAIENFKQVLDEKGIDPSTALGTDLFNFVSTLTPIVNVDLFIHDSDGRVLLSYRDNDPTTGSGWHIPGGCVRFRETLDSRIHKTAFKELGTDIIYNPRPVLAKESFGEDGLADQNDHVRGHFISLLYDCTLSPDAKIINCDGEKIAGHLGWFTDVPEGFIEVQQFYKPYLEAWFSNPWIKGRLMK